MEKTVCEAKAQNFMDKFAQSQKDFQEKSNLVSSLFSELEELKK